MNRSTVRSTLLEKLETVELLNSLPDGAYITDCDRTIVFWNTAAERITGWASHEVVGRSCFDNLLQHVDQDGRALCGRETCPLHRSIVTGRRSCEPCMIYAKTKCGQRTPVEVSVAPLRDRTGRVIGGVETFRDVTDKMQDLLRAQAIQNQTLQRTLPDDPRVSIGVCHRSSDLVGGDFHRVEQVGTDTYAVVLADVMGHGVAAALYTMTLDSLVEEHRPLLHSPADFLETMNHDLHTLIHEAGYFATGIAILFNARTGQLLCARAGHPQGLMFHSREEPERVGRVGPALGMFPSGKWSQSEHRMAPGDLLLLYSDGATELFDPGDNELGIRGLEKLVGEQLRGAPDQDLDFERLLVELLQYTNQIRLPDDLTLITLRRTC